MISIGLFGFYGISNIVGYCYGDIPHDVTAWMLPDIINSDLFNK